MKKQQNAHLKPGIEGYATTRIACVGFIMVGNREYEAISQKGIIPANSAVVVTGWEMGRPQVVRSISGLHFS